MLVYADYQYRYELAARVVTMEAKGRSQGHLGAEGDVSVHIRVEGVGQGQERFRQFARTKGDEGLTGHSTRPLPTGSAIKAKGNGSYHPLLLHP